LRCPIFDHNQALWFQGRPMWKSHPLSTISLVIAACLAALLGFLLFQRNATTPPTEFARNARNLRPLELPAPPPVLDADASRDATPLYRAAIEIYAKDSERYQRFADSGTWDEFKPATLPALQSILDATACARGEIFKSNPTEIITFGPKPKLEALRTLGQLCTDRIALLALRRNDYDSARRYLLAGFALGQKLAAERLTYDEFEAGLSLLGASVQGLARLAEDTGDSARAEALRAYDQSRLAFFREHITPTLHILRSIDAKIVGDHAGDITILAIDSQEPMWRTEAILSLGRMRFFVGTARSADQRAASRTLQKLSRSSDEITKTAAQTAMALTVEQYRSQQ
jgi:hypothetical protein